MQNVTIQKDTVCIALKRDSRMVILGQAYRYCEIDEKAMQLKFKLKQNFIFAYFSITSLIQNIKPQNRITYLTYLPAIFSCSHCWDPLSPCKLPAAVQWRKRPVLLTSLAFLRLLRLAPPGSQLRINSLSIVRPVELLRSVPETTDHHHGALMGQHQPKVQED